MPGSWYVTCFTPHVYNCCIVSMANNVGKLPDTNEELLTKLQLKIREQDKVIENLCKKVTNLENCVVKHIMLHQNDYKLAGNNGTASESKRFGEVPIDKNIYKKYKQNLTQDSSNTPI